MKALESHRLYRRSDLADLDFETTRDLEPLAGPLGQPRAVSAVEFGIGMAHPGYNIFAFGPPGTGKYQALERYLEAAAENGEAPLDVCYVNNFEDSQKPDLLRLPPGRGRELQRDMQKLVDDLGSTLSSAFESDQYQTRRQMIEESFEERQSKALSEINEKAQGEGIALLRTPMGLAFAPVDEGGDDVLSNEEFQKLPEEERERLEEKIETFQGELQKVMRQLPTWQREQRDQVQELDQEISRLAVEPPLEELRERYADLEEVVAFLEAVEKDILENAQAFVARESGQLQEMLQMAGGGRGLEQPLVRRYGVNVLVDHDEEQGAPVVYEANPTYQNLIGRIEHISQMGALVTDFNLIRPGALHRASGGFLLIDALRLLTQPFAWPGLKRALESQKIKIEPLGEAMSLVSTYSLEPEPMPLEVKIVLIGEPRVYYLLSALDPDFPRLFKVAADFAEEVERNAESEIEQARLLAHFVAEEELKPFDRDAVARILEHGARWLGDGERLSLNVRRTIDLLREADHWAGTESRDVVGAADVERAIEAQIFRSDRLRELSQESILRGIMLIDTEGERVGRVNGLSVLQLGDFSFGRPSRITARVRLGKGEVVDIEREVELSGPLHSKGVLILEGFLGGRYAHDRPLALKASLVFEQSYGGVDGDSASSAELYALVSVLSDLPIRQSFAVTGSVNQQGEVQAIGGVNQKIEGFFDICRARGLTGEQGVLIPASNVEHLMLKREVIEAVEAGKFHVYPVSTIDEGIEILTGETAGEAGDDGHFPEGTINHRVELQLARFAEQAREFAAGAEKKKTGAAGGEAP